jgi:integrase
LKFKETDIRDGALLVAQNKTGKRLRIAVIGELAKVIDRILERKRTHKVRNLILIYKEDGQPLTKSALRKRFDKARAVAGVSFQFRDLRAKAGTDKANAKNLRDAQKQLGHQTIQMTEHYVRNRLGEKVEPTK